jgi:hypothetical protein
VWEGISAAPEIAVPANIVLWTGSRNVTEDNTCDEMESYSGSCVIPYHD